MFTLCVNSSHLLFDHIQFALIHGPNILGSYAILLFTASDIASITSHIHKQVFFFALAPSFHSFWSYFSTLLQQHTGNLPTCGIHLSMSYLFTFHTVHVVLKAEILKWFTTAFSSGPDSSRPLHHSPSSWVALLSMTHSFIELDKAVVHVFRNSFELIQIYI